MEESISHMYTTVKLCVAIGVRNENGVENVESPLDGKEDEIAVVKWRRRRQASVGVLLLQCLDYSQLYSAFASIYLHRRPKCIHHFIAFLFIFPRFPFNNVIFSFCYFT